MQIFWGVYVCIGGCMNAHTQMCVCGGAYISPHGMETKLLGHTETTLLSGIDWLMTLR